MDLTKDERSQVIKSCKAKFMHWNKWSISKKDAMILVESIVLGLYKVPVYEPKTGGVSSIAISRAEHHAKCAGDSIDNWRKYTRLDEW